MAGSPNARLHRPPAQLHIVAYFSAESRFRTGDHSHIEASGRRPFRLSPQQSVQIHGGGDHVDQAVSSGALATDLWPGVCQTCVRSAALFVV